MDARITSGHDEDRGRDRPPERLSGRGAGSRTAVREVCCTPDTLSCPASVPGIQAMPMQRWRGGLMGGVFVAGSKATTAEPQGAGLRVVARREAPVRLQRSEGRARLAFKRRGGDTVLADLYQSGCSKVRLPASHGRRDAEAVLLNTAGGLTDGDSIATEVRWGEGAGAVVTSQAAERVYKSRGGEANIETRLDAGPSARACWLPQETILFDGGRLVRRTEVRLHETACLLACESLVLGRAAMGETVQEGAVHDGWRIRVGGSLVFADALRLDGDIAGAVARPAVTGGATALATVLYVGADAGDALPVARAALDGDGAGATLIGPVLVVRLLCPKGAELRSGLGAVLERLMPRICDGQGAPRVALPRVWRC